jgi:hypothetical protein
MKTHVSHEYEENEKYYIKGNLCYFWSLLSIVGKRNQGGQHVTWMADARHVDVSVVGETSIKQQFGMQRTM